MNKPIALLLTLCVVAIVASAFTQNADTSVVMLPQDIVYKALP